MVSVRLRRPAAGIARSGAGRGAVFAVLVGLAIGATACGKKDEKPAVDSTIVVAAPAPPPKPEVPIPVWPSDTSTYAVDRPLAIRPQMRARIPRCSKVTPVVAVDSVGPIYPGQSLSSIVESCSKVYPVFHFDDGSYGPAIAVMLGKALVIADLSGTARDAVVTRVAAFDHARTAKGIGAGSPLTAVQRAYGTPIWRRSQCSVDATFDGTPGLVVRVGLPEQGSDAVTCTDLRRLAYGTDFSHFPRGARVSWIGTELAGAR